jgi:hypothetical protein
MVGLGSVDNTSDAAKPVSTAAQAALDLKAPLASPTFTGTVTVPTPVNSTDSSTKGYVDAVKQGLDIKDSVRVASTANISIATELINASVIDGVTVSTGDRVLLKNQSAPAENGIYVVVASGAASRSLDADVSADVTSGMYVFVSQGTANAGTGFVLITADPIVLGTTPISFTAFSGAGQVIAGNGLSESGNTLSIDTAVTADLSTAQTFTNKSISGGQITSAVANATLAATVTTNANLTGDVTSVGNATTLTNAPVISKVLTGYTSGAGTVAATDTILQAFQKINGNDALRETSSNKDASGGYAGLTLLKLNLRNAANTITNFFTTAATVARTWTMPDKDGTVAMTSDITGINSGTNTGDQTTITGNAGTATALQTARTIGGTSFDGTANISISTVAATALTGTVDSARLSGAYSGVTGLGTLTALVVDNVSVDLNTVSTTSGALNLTPLAGQDLKANLSGGGEFTIYGGETWWGDSSALGFLGYTGGMPIIGSIGALALVLYTNGVERLRIDSSGNVGIGTTSPTTLLSVNGVASFGAGTAALPSLAAFGDLDTGIWYPASNTMAVSTGGAERMRIDSAGVLIVGGGAVSSSRLGQKIDSSSSSTWGGVALSTWSNADQNHSPVIDFNRSRSGTIGTHSIVQNGDSLGYISFNGSDGASFVEGVYITAQVDGTPGINDMPTRLVFSTTADGAAGPVEKMRITSAGNVGIGTTTPGEKLEIGPNDSTSKSIKIRHSSVPGYITSGFDGTFAYTSFSTNSRPNDASYTTPDNIGYGNLFFTQKSMTSTLSKFVFSSAPATSGTPVVTDLMTILQTGEVGIGAAPNPNAILDVTSTTKAFMPPRMTTTQKNAIASPTAGMMVYDSTLNKLSLYTTAWETVTSI